MLAAGSTLTPPTPSFLTVLTVLTERYVRTTLDTSAWRPSAD